jgi:hypothetical protein
VRITILVNTGRMEPCDWEPEGSVTGSGNRSTGDSVADGSRAKPSVKRRGLPISLLDGAKHATPTTPRREKQCARDPTPVPSERRESVGYATVQLQLHCLSISPGRTAKDFSDCTELYQKRYGLSISPSG